MKNRATGVLATLVLVLGFAGSAQASSISLLWTAVNGTGVAPTSSITLANGDTAILTVLVNADAAGLTNATVSLGFDSSFLTANAASVCPGPPAVGNLAPGVCGLAFPFLSPLGTPQLLANEVRALSAASTTAPTTLVNTTFALAEVTFSYSGTGGAQVDFANIPGLDGFVDNSFVFSTIPTPVTPALINGGAVPEPGTLGLMAFGLAALGAAGRRR